MVAFAPVSSSPPRYSAPDPSRQRLRLVAAVGLLACAALVVGGLVHLLSDTRPEPAKAPATASASVSTTASPDPGPTRDSLDVLVLEVERAEQAVGRARAALQRARARGDVDAAQLDWLERRLDALVGGVPSRDPARPTTLDPPRDL